MPHVLVRLLLSLLLSFVDASRRSRSARVQERSIQEGWTVRAVEDMTSSPPPPSLLPTGPIPGPIIAAASSTTSGFVNVAVKQFPKDSRCYASTVVFEYAPVTIGAVQETVKLPASLTTTTSIPMNRAGYYTVYAFIKCTTGEVSEKSNGLTVFSQILDLDLLHGVLKQ